MKLASSIKDNEHLLRENINNQDFIIAGINQSRPSNFTAELKNIKFKEALVQFFIEHWATKDAADYIGGKIIYLNFDKCYKYSVKEGKVYMTIDYDLNCAGHEEADTKIVYHVCNIEQESNVLIRCSDTDILVIMLGNMEYLKSSLTIWMELGVGNRQRCINVTKLYKHLGHQLCSALPEFHAFTGCDYNPAFYRKGKKKPFDKLQNSSTFQEAFCSVSKSNMDDSIKVFEIVEEFVCRLYNLKEINQVNEGRLAIFSKNYKANNNAESFKKQIQNYDATFLPPCQSELQQHILRSRNISNVWANAYLKYPTEFNPNKYGWKEEDGNYTFHWFDGEELPNIVKDVIIQPDEDHFQSDPEMENNGDGSTDKCENYEDLNDYNDEDHCDDSLYNTERESESEDEEDAIDDE